MPAPIPDLSSDQQCHHYQAPTGMRCGSPAMKGEYYCYHHLVKTNYKKNQRVLIDPEVTRMEVPPIEDRASIFVALAAVIHRLAENTIDTRRAGQMIYGLQVAMRALEPPPSQRFRTTPAAQRTPAAQSESQPAGRAECAGSAPDPSTQPASGNSQPAPRTIPITKESLLYFLRSRHCYNCNAELFPAEELTERRNPGAPPEIIEEANPRLPAPQPAPAQVPADTSGTLPTLQAVAEKVAHPGVVILRDAQNLSSCFRRSLALASREKRPSGLRIVAQKRTADSLSRFDSYCLPLRLLTRSYLIISEIVPAPTVLPPSRMAKRRPFSMATGVCSVTSNCTLSPGITISVPAGSVAEPVTSVVRK
jgi:hypothetical protein